jgi:hypothetical protein
MFKSRGEGNVVYKCSVRLLDDSFLELEFQVDFLELFFRPSPRIMNESCKKFMQKHFGKRFEVIARDLTDAIAGFSVHLSQSVKDSHRFLN